MAEATDQAWRGQNIDRLALPERLRKALYRYGITTVGQLADLSDKQLLRMEGVAHRSLLRVRHVLEPSGDGRAGKRGPLRSQRRADDPSHGAVTREVLDVARYIADETAQLEAVAITAHLYRLAYLLGMAKVESEIIVRTKGAEACTDQSWH
jgi:hypothetical protein